MAVLLSLVGCILPFVVVVLLYPLGVESTDSCPPVCTSTFEVRFGQCNESAPEPTTPNRTVDSHHHDECQELSVQFEGDVDIDHYDIQWTNVTGHLLCADDDPSPGSKYTCNRTIVGQCIFTSYLWICDFEPNDLGVYCAQSHSVTGGPDSRNESCMTLSAPTSSVSKWAVIGGVVGIVGIVLLSLVTIVTCLRKIYNGCRANLAFVSPGAEGIRDERTPLLSQQAFVSPAAEGIRDERTPLLSQQDRHPEAKVTLPHVLSVPNKEADLSSFCPHTIPRVPAIIIHCVNEIEKRDLTEVGIYRKSGSVKEVKEVKEQLLKAKGNPRLDKVANIHVLCGVLKDFLRSLREPILTFRMHNAFKQAAEAESDEEGLASTLEAIAELPPANKDTLAFLILHLQKVASYSDANKMPVESLAMVFGPTIVGHGCANPDPVVVLQDTRVQSKVMQRLLGISGDYWRRYLSPVNNPHPLSPSPSSP